MTAPLLDVEDLTTEFHTDEGSVGAVDGVTFAVETGESVGIVGESGCGKSATARTIVGLIRGRGSVDGRARWRGEDLLGMDDDRLREVRGAEVGMVFQHARRSFDPTYTVGAQVAEGVRAHDDPGERAARKRARDLLAEVGLPEPARTFDRYPHELSGGQVQRAAVAAALAGDPDLLIADEPTTGLDVSTQAALLDLLERLADERDLALLFISHDLGVVARVCDRLLVMYAGRIAERGPTDRVLADPRHPYTQLFLRAVPDVEGERPLEPIEGSPPSLIDPPSGCRFHPRCPAAKERCAAADPPEVAFGADRAATCHGYTDAYGEPPDGAGEAGVTFDE